MDKQTRSYVLIIGLLAASLCSLWLPVDGSVLYPGPSKWSLGDLASYTQPLIASGAALPSASNADEGQLFLVVDAASATLYRKTGSIWTPAGGGGSTGGGGVATDTVIAYIATETANREAADATLTADLSAHQNDTVDPHSASPTFTEGITVGSGTTDVEFTRIATGVAQIASYLALPYETATPPVSSGVMTIWADANTVKLRVHDGDNTWHDAY